jgi:hypothetical protein
MVGAREDLSLYFEYIFSIHLSGLHSLVVPWSLAEAQCDYLTCATACHARYSVHLFGSYCSGIACKCGKLHQYSIYLLATIK